MAKDRSTYGPRNETHRVYTERFKGADKGVRVRKEQLCEDEPSDNAVEEKIVPLYGCANRARYHSPPQLNLVFLI
jgi:hypothetical protein